MKEEIKEEMKEEIKEEEKNIFKDCKNGLERFIKISNFDINKPDEFKILSKHSDEIKNANLFFENGGSWCRKESINKNKYKIATIKKNGNINYLWDVEEEEKYKIKEAFNKFNLKDNKNTGILYIGVFGIKNKKKYDRGIHHKIVEYFKNKSCCVCGSNTNIEIDHKNDLYNDPRVLNKETQEQNDFQALCKHCNDQKRQVNKKMRQTKKRYGATNIPSLKPFGIDFIKGDETYDINDSNTMVGTYWYDPVEFNKEIIKILTNQISNLNL
jgi:5-methylcytosine-specific restriction endonuclease McrA